MILLLLLFLSASQAFEKLSCINFYGLETESMKPVCSWINPPEYFLDILIDRVGLNSVRIPISGSYIETGEYSELRNLIDTCQQRNLRVILDYHRTRSDKQYTTPTDTQTLSQFVDSWVKILESFQNDVYAVSLFNEDQTSTNDQIIEYSISIIYALESYFPNKFIYIVGAAFWNQRATGLEKLFDSINPERLMIDLHWYPFIGDVSYIENSVSELIPIDNYFVGEIGWTFDDLEWIRTISKWSRKKGFNKFCGWTIAYSDLGGTFWKDDCQTFFPEKMDTFKSLVFHPNIRTGNP